MQVYTVLLASVVAIFGCSRSPAGPKIRVKQSHLVVEPDAQITASEADKSEVLLDYELSNVGRSPLVVDRIEGSCGCSKNWIESETVTPGESTHLYARVIRGPANRHVSFTLFTNDPANREVRLTALLRRTTEPPYVREVTAAVSFGAEARPGDRRTLLIFTHEKPDSGEPWIHDVVSDDTAVRVKFQDVTEQLIHDGELLARTYQYDVTVGDDVSFGRLNCRLSFRDEQQIDVGGVIALGHVVAPVLVVPNTLVLRYGASEPSEGTIIVRAVETTTPLKVGVETKLPPGFELACVASSNEEARFQLTVAHDGDLKSDDRIEQIEFTTNHPKQPTARLRLIWFGGIATRGE